MDGSGPDQPEARPPILLGVPGLADAVEIGRGGFGAVYRARQTDFDREVAVKVLTAAFVDEDTQRRFERERRALGAVSAHPNIVTIFDAGVTDDGRPYLIMDYLSGGSLADRLRRGDVMDWDAATSAGVVLAGALETAHRAGILHRDIKPENVLVSAFDEPHLADFGIARLSDGTETRSGVISASIAHAAPEILDGRPPSAASDVYSLASTLAGLVLGHAPYVRDTDESLQPVIVRVLTHPPPDLTVHAVPAGLAEVLARGLAKDPADRYDSAEAFGLALQEARRAAGVAPRQMRLDAGPAVPTSGSQAPGIGAASAQAEPALPDHTVIRGPSEREPLVATPTPSPRTPTDSGTSPGNTPSERRGAAHTEPTPPPAPGDERRPSRRGLAIAAVAGVIVLAATVVNAAGRGVDDVPASDDPSIAAAAATPTRSAEASDTPGGATGTRSPTAEPTPESTAEPTLRSSPEPTDGPSGGVTATPPRSDPPSPSPSPTAPSPSPSPTPSPTPSPSPTPTNRAPSARSTSVAVTSGDSTDLAATTLGSDPDGDTLTLDAESSTTNGGRIEILSGGTILRYHAPSGFVGTDTIRFTVSDGRLSDAGQVTVDVQGSNRAPTAGDDSYTIDPGYDFVGDVSCNDTDPDGDALTIQLTSAPEHGAAELRYNEVYCGGYGIEYTPNEGASGVTDTYTYRISDGRGGSDTATVTVTIQ